MDIEPVQTKRKIEEMLALLGRRPKKRFGQNFLIDGNLMRRLVAEAELSARDLVVEVGAGTGELTDLLARRAGRVLCIEIDRELHGLLVERFRTAPNVQPILGDILESKHRLMPEVAGAIREHDAGASGQVKLVANLPYQVATPVVMNLLVDHPQVRLLCFTVQAEVGERITAASGSKAFGPLGIIAQTLCHVEVITKLKPQAFWPQPQVDSVMIRMVVGTSPFANPDEVRAFASLVRRTFEHRRKTLRSALGYVLDEPSRDHVCERFGHTCRPEQLSVVQWHELFRIVHP